MGKTLSEIMQNLPRERAQKIEALAAKLIAEYIALRDIKESMELARGVMTEDYEK
jgi:hypothetical protein